ncbi:MAG TPA: hypothetical protein VHY22_18470 [Chthoniobacteraceae bacterium]|jgi:caa(3)-type oxidase subunit IV|nr:hypothetical protein [Chthoniobacteraceae bacterium]
MEQSHETSPSAGVGAALQGSKHFKGYVAIGITQVVFVLAAVGASFLPFHNPTSNILVVLFFAACNAACVASFSMHLKSEKWIIYRFLIITAVFLIGLFALTYIAFHDRLRLN